MQLKFILRRDDGSRAQVAVTADATASVSDLATALATGDPDYRPARVQGSLTLKLEQSAFDNGTKGRVLDPVRSLIESGMRSGSTVSITAAPAGVPRSRRGRSVAVLRVLDGPDVGREFSLPRGNSVIGRGARSDVQLNDHGVAEVHAAVSVGESIEISNLAGPTGVLIGGRPVQRATVGSSDVVKVAGTSVAILQTVRPGAVQSDSVAIEFNRSPRVVARFEKRTFVAPKAPQLPEPAHFPIVSMVLPLVLGLGMFAVTRSLLAVVFIALSPLLMLGMYFDTKFQSKKKYEADVRRFADAQRQLAADLTAAQQVERAVRRGETPALGEVVEAIHRLGPLLWTHRPEHPEFLTARIGLGDALSRCQVELSRDNDAEPKYLQQLVQLRDEFAQVSDVPLVADLRESGAFGVCGPRGIADGVARGIIMQLIALHSPAELTITAFASQQSRTSWEWLEWLPHAGSAYSPLSGNHLTDSENGGIALLSRLEDLVKVRAGAENSGPAPTFGVITSDADTDTRAPIVLPAVIVLVDDTAPIDRSRLTRLAERGASVGVHVIWVATQITSLPAACRTFVLIENEQSGSTVGEVRAGAHRFPVACDAIDVADARQVALLLAPVVDVGAAVDDDTDLPRSVSYLSLSGTGVASDPATVARLWMSNDSVTPRDGSAKKASNKPAPLAALVGSTGLQDFYLDLREHGPHALVGGTTGSGKSEFLQSWMLGMATANSPDRLTFLLVDYKGGTAFAECAQLPHTVGLVTDLSPHLVRRALTSLGAEIKRREELLNLKRAKDLVSLEQMGDPETPPALVIIVDEFAALATEVPEFVDGVIDVAQRGRSLGLHLILATQRPAGVIKDNLRANTNLRIALRLNDVDDSVDVVGDPLAAHFAPEIPGRAVAKTGPGRLTTFQAGYVGGWTGDQPDTAPIDIWEFVFGRRRPWNTQVANGSRATAGPTDIARIVNNVRAASDQMRIRTPRKPWLPPLQPTYALESISAPSGHLVIGRLDLPERQQQPTATYEPDQGNLAIVGTSGSGKSTALRTLAISAALASDGPTHIYGFDFASGSLRMLEPLPHVAAIIDGEDDERIGRVLRRLVTILDERSRRFSRANVSNLTGYRQSVDPEEPRILLLVDGIGAFRETYELIGHSTHFALFNQIVSDGRRLGMHVVLTGERPGALSTSLASMMQRRLVLRLASDDDYMLTGEPHDILSVNSPPGRGIMGGHEVQVAVFGGDDNVAAQARAITELAARMRAQGFTAPEPVVRLSEHVDLDTLPVTVGGAPSIGIADETLAPVGILPQGLLMLTGPPGSGRTTALVSLAQAVRRANTGFRIVHLAPAHSAIAKQDVFTESAVGSQAVVDLLGSLTSRLGFGVDLMMVIESITEFTNSEVETDLSALLKSLAGTPAFVVGEAEVSTWGQAWTLAQPFKSGRRGLLLAPSGVESDSLLSTPIGVIRRHDFPPGRGVLIEKGKGVWVQVAQPVYRIGNQ
ncbi:FtsK/SpoIIIE domain-containing protein [Mycobacterium sp. 852014-52144_SCH5372336]|uniref:FtsK/SpoIIIE domain-containing protein n=1 Tax=Mycobacterium sp. 852014-52144_SCH5372336 TaxID=1834115 RepID=UPI0007FF81B1|nr:FtsK/SpoIIIE domain-containing protein [Mycobacterium sp. 852014-52144_SCH5372336]OBB77394.1 cell division protein FtsK [Mycobacterium sp. 852014-52144_SCH5372336]